MSVRDVEPVDPRPHENRRSIRAAAVGLLALAALIGSVLILRGGADGGGAPSSSEPAQASGSTPPTSQEPPAPSSADSTAAPSGAGTSAPAAASAATGFPPLTGSEAPVGVVVHITSALWSPGTGTFEITSAVTGVETQAGTCTATITGPGGTYSAEADAVFDGRGVSCGVMTVSAAPAAVAGLSWEARVDYHMAGWDAVSEIVPVKQS